MNTISPLVKALALPLLISSAVIPNLFISNAQANTINHSVSHLNSEKLQHTVPKNIIMVIADGMGPAYTSAYRYYHDDPATIDIEQTVFDRHLKGRSSTYPAPVSGYVTDSAASATALATGVKTYNGAIGVDVDKQPLLTVLEWAKQQGKATGVVVTSRINHATPASYLSHNESRSNYDEIANSYIDNGIKADVYFGGGWVNFIRSDRNIVTEFQQAGFQYIDQYDQVSDLSTDKPVIGLFSEYGLPWALDDSNKYRLTPLVEAATKHLQNDKGFFMLVEASQIDWAGHNNDIAAAMHEIDDLASVMLYLETYVEDNPDTLVVLTADHSTGGFSLAAKGEYRWDPEIIRNMTQSPQSIADQIIANSNSETRSKTQLPSKEQLSNWLSFSLTDQEYSAITQVDAEFSTAHTQYLLLDEVEKQKIKDDYKVPTLAGFYRTALMDIIDKRTNTGWTTGGHTGIDVPVFAFGKQSELFTGQIDNTDIAKKIFTLLGK
ncbi:alkaline phosphatase [Colwellia echini]|uniref:Alkaline phosphatase n=1 Tax=Colwellia echini TaxID=1982103 RepID=A0ABY3MTQ1_9GAMM|nr:alkaline phosphatase [Colwellia echini]TYK64570.1 alkaline phosphatase [Colwellia echini]